MRNLFGTLAALTITTGAFASDPVVTESYIGSVSVQPCSSWSYDFNISGYKCNFLDRNVEVPEHRDVQRLADLVERLEAKISDLEQRVAILEAR